MIEIYERKKCIILQNKIEHIENSRDMTLIFSCDCQIISFVRLWKENNNKRMWNKFWWIKNELYSLKHLMTRKRWASRNRYENTSFILTVQKIHVLTFICINMSKCGCRCNTKLFIHTCNFKCKDYVESITQQVKYTSYHTIT